MSLTKQNMRLEDIEEKVEDSIYFTEEDLLELQEIHEDHKRKMEDLKKSIMRDVMNYTEIDF